jgi:diguanylate cyclase (GGDEF)-like protein
MSGGICADDNSMLGSTGRSRPTHDALIPESIPAWRPTLDRLRLVERVQLLATIVLGVGALLLAVVIAVRIVDSVEDHRRTLEIQNGIESIRYDARVMQVRQLESRYADTGGSIPPIVDEIQTLRDRVAALPMLSARSSEAELRQRLLDDLAAFVVLSRFAPSGIRAGTAESRRGYELARPAIKQMEQNLDRWVAVVRAHTTRELDATAPLVDRLAAILVGTLAALILLSVILATILHQTRRRLAGELASSTGELERLSGTDALTALDNRRAFRAYADDAVRAAAALETPLCVAILDIDHFKTINDAYGHDVGDRTLVRLAKLLTASAPSGHRIARLGGEEFGWLMPHTDAQAGTEWIQRAHDALAAKPVEGAGVLTFSCGIAERGGSSEIEHLLREADDALYEAKAAGRNRTVVRAAVTQPV